MKVPSIPNKFVKKQKKTCGESLVKRDRIQKGCPEMHYKIESTDDFVASYPYGDANGITSSKNTSDRRCSTVFT